MFAVIHRRRTGRLRWRRGRWCGRSRRFFMAVVILFTAVGTMSRVSRRSGNGIVCGAPGFVRRGLVGLRRRRRSGDDRFVHGRWHCDGGVCRVWQRTGLLGVRVHRQDQQGAYSGGQKLGGHGQSSKSVTGRARARTSAQERRQRRQRTAGQLLLRLSGLVPGRALRAVLDEANGEGRRSNDDCVGAVESRDSEMSGGWRDGAQAERGARTAGGVRLFTCLGVCRIGVDQGVVRLACMLATVMSVRIGHVLVGLHARINRNLAGLLVSRAARHTVGRKRVQRKHGQQEPNQKCLECAVHRCREYSTTFFGLKQLLRLTKVRATGTPHWRDMQTGCVSAQHGSSDFFQNRKWTRSVFLRRTRRRFTLEGMPLPAPSFSGNSA